MGEIELIEFIIVVRHIKSIERGGNISEKMYILVFEPCIAFELLQWNCFACGCHRANTNNDRGGSGFGGGSKTCREIAHQSNLTQ